MLTSLLFDDSELEITPFKPGDTWPCDVPSDKLGAMPSWIDRLNAEKVKMLTLYVYQLSNIVQ